MTVISQKLDHNLYRVPRRLLDSDSEEEDEEKEEEPTPMGQQLQLPKPPPKICLSTPTPQQNAAAGVTPSRPTAQSGPSRSQSKDQTPIRNTISTNSNYLDRSGEGNTIPSLGIQIQLLSVEHFKTRRKINMMLVCA